tara:strand:- start:2183 stop:3031 length:849 start_codon:yes stop_codon:yes gene_type:complete
MGGKSKKKREAEQDDEPMEEPTEEDKEAQEKSIEKRKSKKKKREAEQPEEEEPEEVPEEPNAEKKKKDPKARARTARDHKKLSGYRAKARECGYERKSGVVSASGIDSYASCLSAADAKRLMRFVPEVLNMCSYDKDECKERMELSYVSVPQSAARETQARCEILLRNIANEAVLQAVREKKMAVDADIVHSIIRKYAHNMAFSAILPPKGLIRYAQAQGSIPSLAKDSEAQKEETSENKELVAAAKKLEKQENDRKASKRKSSGKNPNKGKEKGSTVGDGK